MAQLYDSNPYRGFYRALGKDMQTWGGNKPIFGVLVEQVRPRLVVEVGSWKGGSAISMASRIRDLDLRGQVLCVDTWLGSLEHWLAKEDRERRSYYDSLQFKHGYPQLYYQFIVNVVARTPTEEGFAAGVEWARGVTSALGADAATYVNFTGESNAAVVRASYPPDTYRRLVDLKNDYDPTNLFRLNQNIKPAG